jgi:hypothetical protein
LLGHVRFDVCTPQGEILNQTITKGDGRELFSASRKLRWGDNFIFVQEEDTETVQLRVLKRKQKEELAARIDTSPVIRYIDVDKQTDEQVEAAFEQFRDEIGANGEERADAAARNFAAFHRNTDRKPLEQPPAFETQVVKEKKNKSKKSKKVQWKKKKITIKKKAK